MLFIYFALSNQLTAMGNKLEATQPNTANLTLKFHKVAQNAQYRPYTGQIMAGISYNRVYLWLYPTLY